MASVVVMDSALKRTAVKVSPGTHMRDVLEQACQARKISPELYALRSKADKTVDLSQPFRLSGLTSGATLTLVQASRTPSVVNVALQLPDSEGGGRLSDKFPSTTSLWLILRKFEDAVAGQLPRKLNITQRAVPYEQTAASGRLEYEQPCLHIMGRNLESFVDLQKTLAQLGYNSGTALLRLNFKCVGQPLEEAMQEIEEYFKSVDVPSAGVAPATATATELDRDSPMPDADTPPASSIENVGVAASSKTNDNDSVHTINTINNDNTSTLTFPEDNTIGSNQADESTCAVEKSPPPETLASNLKSADSKPPSQRTQVPSESASFPTTNPEPAIPQSANSQHAKQAPSFSTSSESANPTPSTSDHITSEDANPMPGISVYLPPSNSAPAASLEEEDPQTFEPSIDHAKAHQAAIARMTQNKRLLSDKELAEQTAAQEAALQEVKTVLIRVKYPDQSMIETEITADTTAKDLYAKVNATLASADAIGNFQLRFMGAKGMQELPDVANKRLVKSFGFKGKVLVTIIWSPSASAKVRKGPCLKPELMNVAKDLKVELGNQRKEGESAHKAAMEKKPRGAAGGKGKNPADFENKMKKLLGLGRK